MKPRELFRVIPSFQGYIQRELKGDHFSCQMCGRPKNVIRALNTEFFTHPHFGSICGDCSTIWL